MPRKTNFTTNGSSYYRTTATIGKAPDGSPIRKQFYGKGKKESEQKRDDYLHKINGGLSVGFDKITFGVAYRQWFETVHKPTLAASSVRRYESNNTRIYTSNLITMMLVNIKSLHIQLLYHDLLDSGVSINTVRNTNNLLSPFFTYALKTDMITKNPMLAVEAPRERKIESEKHILSKAEIQKLVAHAQLNNRAVIFAFLALTGLRQGEALALTHNDIDLKENIIKVNKSVSYLTINGKYQAMLSATKTASSTRDIPLFEGLRPILQAHINSEKEKCLRLGIPFGSDNILFSSGTGRYIEGKSLRTSFKRLLHRLELSTVTVHSLRHYFCTTLAENGVNIKTASILMGHSDINTTMKVYTHIQEEEKKRGIATLINVFS